MARLNLDIIRAVKRSPLEQEEIVAAIDNASNRTKAKTQVAKRRTYNRRDMEAEA